MKSELNIGEGQKVFFVANYQSLMFALRICDASEIYILTRNIPIKLFCEEAGIGCFLIDQLEFLKLAGLSLSERQKHKNYLDSIIEVINNKTIVFCFYGYALVELYMLFKLHNNNQVFYHCLETDPIYPKANLATVFKSIDNYRKTTFNWLIYLYVYGIRFNIFYKSLFENSSFEYFLGISPEKLMAKFDKYDLTEELNCKKINLQCIGARLNLATFDVIYIDNLRAQHTEKHAIIDDILSRIKEKGYSIAGKPHPSVGVPSSLRKYVQIDKTIPSEMLFASVRKCIIGISSTSLKSLAQETTVFSIINLIELFSENGYKEIKAFLGDQVIYPDSINEILDFLND